MKFALAFLAVIGTASAGRPQLSISLRDGDFNSLDGLEPTLTWSDSSRSGDLSLDYGIEAEARPTTDIASLPRRIWGKMSTKVGGWGVTAATELDGNMDMGDIDITADNGDISVAAVTSTGGVKSIQATKTVDMKGSSMTITPRVNLETDDRDVVIDYDSGDLGVTLTASADNQEVEARYSSGDVGVKVTATKDSQEVEATYQAGDLGLKLTASQDDQELEATYSKDATDVTLVATADEQEITVSQQLDKNNRISPTINSNGDISIGYERSLDDGSLSATLTPNDSLNVEWNDGAWTANVDMPIKGNDIRGANVHVKRDVVF